MMFNKNIEAVAKVNSYFTQVLVTGNHLQIVVSSIPPKNEIGEKLHEADQVFIIVEGEGFAMVAGEKSPVTADHMVFVPANTVHNMVNTGAGDLKLYTIYSPPHHKPGTIHSTKAEAASEGL